MFTQMNLRHWLSTLSVALALPALATVGQAADEIELQQDITYTTVGDRELKLDLARPKDARRRPAIVFIHGGGWAGGRREGYRGRIQDAARRGYVAATVTYRLTEKDSSGKARSPFPAQVEDVKAAVRFLRANADRFGIDPDRIGATGESAGGHLSLMLGLTDESAGLEGPGADDDVSSRVQAVVNVFGPTDMEELHRDSGGASPILETFLGGKPAEVGDAYQKASPVSHVSKDDPPVLTIHGTADRLVPPSQAELLDKKMKALGLTHEMLLLEGQGHGFGGKAARQARDAAAAFFDEHLRPAKESPEAE